MVYNKKQNAVTYRPLNIESFLQVAKSWQSDYKQLQMIKHNYDSFISQLTTGSDDMKKYLSQQQEAPLSTKQRFAIISCERNKNPQESTFAPFAAQLQQG